MSGSPGVATGKDGEKGRRGSPFGRPRLHRGELIRQSGAGVRFRTTSGKELKVPRRQVISLTPPGAFVPELSGRHAGGHTALAYVIEGAGCFGADEVMVEAIRLVVFGDGDQIEVQSETGVRFLFFAGGPFGELIVPYGPFVMNTPQEIMQAIADLQNNTFVQP